MLTREEHSQLTMPNILLSSVAPAHGRSAKSSTSKMPKMPRQRKLFVDYQPPDMESFRCGICDETQKRDRRNCVPIVNNDFVCSDCFQSGIVERFKESIKYPVHYPYCWGLTPLRFQDLKKYISKAEYEELEECYNAKRVELEMPPAKRLYCQEDETFMGSKTGGGEIAVWDECPTCGNDICFNCGRTEKQTPIEVKEKGRGKKLVYERHRCRSASITENLKGLTQGKDYQFCPECDATAEQKDGCNAVQCTNCKTQYCYICASKADHKSDHWKPGKPCPRFNQPGAENALFDDENMLVQDDEYMPDEEDFRLLELCREYRTTLRAVRVMARTFDVPAWVEPLQRLFFLTIRNLIANLGVLDFSERLVMDEGKLAERHDQICAFATHPGRSWVAEELPQFEAVLSEYLSTRIVQEEGERFDRVIFEKE